MSVQYVGLKEINGPLVVLDHVQDASFEEMVQLELPDGTSRDGRIVTIEGDKAVIQVFEGTNGLSLVNTRTRLLGHPMELPLSPEVLGLPVKMDPLVTEGKAGMLKTFQDLTALVDATGICLFTTFGIGLPEIAAQYREAVGSDESDEEILLKGERIWNLEKQFNIAAGVEKDTLPPRLLREKLPEGPAAGKVNDLYTMLAEYYAARGWTAEGIPTPEKLASLNLK